MDSACPPRSNLSGPLVAVAGLYWVALFVATHLPIRALGSHGQPNPFDKLQHLSAFALLALLLCSVASAWKSCPRRLSIYVFLLIGLYGIVDEITQAFVRYRSPDVFDWLADLTGAALGISLFWLARWVLIGRAQPQSPVAPHGNRGT